MFIKQYPYLDNPWYNTVEDSIERQNFLQLIDGFVNQKQYVKLTLLNWDEKPIRAIEGEISNGSLSKDGTSSVRRSCSINTSVSAQTYNPTDLKSDFSLNKKVYVEIGVKNYTQHYQDYPILWFPQGLFLIKSFSCNTSAGSALNLSITMRDKMSLLNGDAGGILPSTTIVDEMDTQLPTGETISKKVPLYGIIQEMVNHWGKEDLNNIVIEDVPLRIKRVMRWTGSYPLYLVSNGGTAEAGNLSYIPQVELPTGQSYLTINNGDDAGYIYDDFYYPEELSMPAGSTVTDVLDKVKSLLGNYEYFYDVYGVFHFREIKNYLNTTQATVISEDMKMKDYLSDNTLPKSVYTFSDDSNIVSINATPQYENIKNDYIVQGLRKGDSSNMAYQVFYHLAIDKKPKTGNYYPNILIYRDPYTNDKVAARPTIIYDDLPQPGEFNTIYYQEGKAFYWSDSNEYKELEIIKFFDTFNPYLTKDWRTELYMQGLVAQKNGTDAGYYWPELQAGWPTIYDLELQQFIGESESEDVRARALTDGNWYLDFIDINTPFGKYSVDAIGRRTNVTINEDINCLFQPEIPNIVFLNLDLEDEDPEKFAKLRDECIDSGQPYAQTRGEVFAGFMTGGYKNGAFDQIKYDLLCHTTYQQSLSITSLPVFYLEPNSRITINDKITNTYGDYVVNNISIQLSPGSTMTMSANEVLERFI